MLILSTNREHAMLTHDESEILPSGLQAAFAKPAPLYRIETPHGVDDDALASELVLPRIRTTCGNEKKRKPFFLFVQVFDSGYTHDVHPADKEGHVVMVARGRHLSDVFPYVTIRQVPEDVLTGVPAGTITTMRVDTSEDHDRFTFGQE